MMLSSEGAYNRFLGEGLTGVPTLLQDAVRAVQVSSIGPPAIFPSRPWDWSSGPAENSSSPILCRVAVAEAPRPEAVDRGGPAVRAAQPPEVVPVAGSSSFSRASCLAQVT